MKASTIDKATVPVPYNVDKQFYYRTYEVSAACEVCGNPAHIGIVELTEEQESQWDADQSAELDVAEARMACAQHFLPVLTGMYGPWVPIQPPDEQGVEMTEDQMREVWGEHG